MADSLKQTLDGARALVGTASDAVKQVQADASRTRLDSCEPFGEISGGARRNSPARISISRSPASVDRVAARAEKRDGQSGTT